MFIPGTILFKGLHLEPEMLKLQQLLWPRRKGSRSSTRWASKGSQQQKELVRAQEGDEQGSDVEGNQEQKQQVVYSRTSHASEKFFSCLGAQKKGNPGLDNHGKNMPLGVNQLLLQNKSRSRFAWGRKQSVLPKETLAQLEYLTVSPRMG